MQQNRNILGIELVYDIWLLLWLIAGFIAFTIIGTLSHELGHCFVANYFGYNFHISYGSMYWWPTNWQELPSPFHDVCILWGGPLQTMLTGTIGLVLLLITYKSFKAAEHLLWWQWLLVFITLFWLREPFNFLAWCFKISTRVGRTPRGDELRMARYAHIPDWTIISIAGIIGFIVLAIVIYRFIPAKQRLTFITAGLVGGITGFVLWLLLLGPIVMP